MYTSLEQAINSVGLPSPIFINTRVARNETIMQTIGDGIVTLSRNPNGTYNKPGVLYG